jgi:hypothetical protein
MARNLFQNMRHASEVQPKLGCQMATKTWLSNSRTKTWFPSLCRFLWWSLARPILHQKLG